MVEQSIFDTLIGAANDRQWWVLAGVIIIMAIGLVKYVTRERFSVAVGKWIVAVSALLRGFAAALLVGAEWWHAAIAAVFVAPASLVFWDRIRNLLPRTPGTKPTNPPEAPAT